MDKSVLKTMVDMVIFHCSSEEPADSIRTRIEMLLESAILAAEKRGEFRATTAPTRPTVKDTIKFTLTLNGRSTGMYWGTQEDMESMFHVISQDGNKVVVGGVK